VPEGTPRAPGAASSGRPSRVGLADIKSQQGRGRGWRAGLSLPLCPEDVAHAFELWLFVLSAVESLCTQRGALLEVAELLGFVPRRGEPGPVRSYLGRRVPARDSKGSEGAEASWAAPPWLGAVSWLWALPGGGVWSSLVMDITLNAQRHGCCRWPWGWGGPLGGTAMPVCIAHGSRGVPPRHAGASWGFPPGALPQPEPAPCHRWPRGEEAEGGPQEVV